MAYENLHPSCIRETEPGNPLHCGHHKENWFDETQHISPTDENCEQRFRYLLTGAIQASDAEDLPASTMINVLALDIAYLKNRRSNAIGEVFDNDFIATASNEELDLLINAIRSTVIADQKAFDHVISRYADQLLGR